MIAQVEANMNSVERLQYYSFELPLESQVVDLPDNTSHPELPSDWPARGEIVATDVHMNYQDGPDVLKGLTFSVLSKEKIGIAGRTGSGKSSLMTALFRIENIRGSVKIGITINLLTY